MKASKDNYDVHLQHTQFKSHNEWWLVEGKNVNVLSICPGNHPSISEHTMSCSEAMRQLALMTTGIEGWKVIHSGHNWHNLVEEYTDGTPAISRNHLVAYLGDDATDAPKLVKMLHEIVNGEWPVDQLRSDVLQYEAEEGQQELVEGSCETCGSLQIVFDHRDEEEQEDYLKCNSCGAVFEESLK